MNVIVAKEHPQDSESPRDVFGGLLMEMAERDGRIVLLDADLIDVAGTRPFADRFPERTFDCGIAEANMAGIAAGLGLNGFVPFIHSFGTFASRRIYDQVFISGAYAGSNVKILGTDPGVTAALNGGTHMPLEDIALMRVVPGMTVLEISDVVMLRDILPRVADMYGMAYIRMPRRTTYKIYEPGSSFEVGKAAKIRDGSDVAILTIGYCLREALTAAETLSKEGIEASIYDMYSIKPIDHAAVLEAAKETGALVAAENHNIVGGLGSAVAELLSEKLPTPLRRIGVRDRFGEVGAPDYLAATFGITAREITAAAREMVGEKRR